MTGRAESIAVTLPVVRPMALGFKTDDISRIVAVGSPWSVLRGYHVLRHSFISACASKGIDQRLLDEWVGHQTDE